MEQQKWEYLMITCIMKYADWTTILNQEEVDEPWEITSSDNRTFESVPQMLSILGSEGWELVSTSPFVVTRLLPNSTVAFTYTNCEYQYFKRRMEDKPDKPQVF